MSYELAKRLYQAGGPLRQRRQRCKSYTYGRQWDDPALDRHGFVMTEGDAQRAQGREPITNNMVRRLVKSVVGRYREITQSKPPLDELDARLLEEFLISGCAIQRVEGGEVQNVSLDQFFVNAFVDPLGRDINAVGMLHDLTMAQLLQRFAAGSQRRVQHIRAVYNNVSLNMHAKAQPADMAPTGVDCIGADSFTRPADPRLYRVVEVWVAEPLLRRRGTQLDISQRWKYAFYAPDGTVLANGYADPGRAHPFVVKYYPLTDGEVHSFVEDLLEQQRYVNKLITAIHHILQCSAKGVLLFPRDALDPNTTWDDVALQWARPDGVIPINSRASSRPIQLASNGAAADAYRLLELQMQLLSDISGVADPLMGKATSANQGHDAFQAQVENATIALNDVFRSFANFIAMRDQLLNQNP